MKWTRHKERGCHPKWLRGNYEIRLRSRSLWWRYGKYSVGYKTEYISKGIYLPKGEIIMSLKEARSVAEHHAACMLAAVVSKLIRTNKHP